MTATLGCKGMVSVDPLLEGIIMRVRKSMVKFEGAFEDRASIEIARAFERPNTCNLNRQAVKLKILSIITLTISFRPLIMVLEDRGVSQEAFLKLQKRAIGNVHMSSDTVLRARQLFREQQLGGAYRISYIFQCMHALGLGMEYEKTALYQLKDPFFERVIQYAKNHVLRAMKHAARIPIPDSYLLVGVADEGPAYQARGMENVFCLSEMQIYGECP